MKSINLLPKRPKQWMKLRKIQVKIITITSIFLGIFIIVFLILFGIDLFILRPAEQKATSEIDTLLSSLNQMKGRQALYLASANKVNTINHIITERFPYDKMFTDLNAIMANDIRLTSASIDSGGILTFSVETRASGNIQSLISNMLAHDFSPSFNYLLRGATRQGDGTYVLEFSFTPKS